jgi:hypothetical protein
MHMRAATIGLRAGVVGPTSACTYSKSSRMFIQYDIYVILR